MACLPSGLPWALVEAVAIVTWKSLGYASPNWGVCAPSYGKLGTMNTNFRLEPLLGLPANRGHVVELPSG